jgi:hypothetical protein
MRSRREAAIVHAYLVAENQMCSVAAFADAFETIDGMTVILSSPGEKAVVNSLCSGPTMSHRIEQAMGGLLCTGHCVYL